MNYKDIGIERERERERQKPTSGKKSPNEPTNSTPLIIRVSIVGGLFIIYLLGKVISSARKARRKKIGSKK